MKTHIDGDTCTRVNLEQSHSEFHKYVQVHSQTKPKNGHSEIGAGIDHWRSG